MARITAEVRVTSLKFQPFAYKDGKGELVSGESLEMRAGGFWISDDGDRYPVSLHVTVHPGHGVVPAIGDCVTVSIERK